MDHDTKRGNSEQVEDRLASCGPQLASDIESRDCFIGKCRKDSKVEDLSLVK
jgi:hypothetical protein